MISFDTEDNSNGEMTLAVFFDGTDHTVFDRAAYDSLSDMKDAIIQFIFDSPEKLFVAHNLEYDLVNIFYPKLFYLEMFYSDNLIFARLAKTRKKFVDSFLYSFSNLKSIGKVIGLEKMETDDFYNVDYCKRDAEIVYRYMELFHSSIADEFKLKAKNTLAGTSHTIFLKRFNKQNLDHNTNPELLHSYYGGRVEVFNTGEATNIHEVDVNSMYPYVMMKHEYPTKDNYPSVKPKEENYFTQVKLKIKRNILFPIIPSRQEKLLFPVGEFVTWATSAELKKAISEGQVEDVEYLQTFNFPEMGFIFVNFVEYFYQKRKEYKKSGNEFYSQFYKLILNSTYGRFGLKGDLHVLKYNPNATGDFAALFVEMEKCDFSLKGINYAIPALVTSYARIVLYDLIQKVHTAGRRVLYCDTDSVYFSGDMIESLPINSELGGLSVNHYDRGYFYNAKEYWCEKNGNKKLKCKGIPAAKREEYFETGTVTYKRPKRLRSALRASEDITPNSWLEFTITKSGIYDKRLPNAGMINTKPMNLKL
jgi:hypothetical protein